MPRLADKIAVITGGAGEIGAATARRFVEEGAKVLLVDINEAALKSRVEDIGGQHASYCVADVSDPAQSENYVQKAVERYGRIDVLFSNAGIEGAVASIIDGAVENFDKVMAVNVRGVWLSLKYTLPVMLKSGTGSIIITSSVAGLRGSPGLSPYVTSKHAVIGIMRSAVKEVASSGIRINTIHPGPIEGRMMSSIEDGVVPGGGGAVRSAFAAQIPSGRYGTPAEIARLTLFLASDESSFCSGAMFSADGGMTAG